MRSEHLRRPARTLAWHPTSSVLAVGLLGGKSGANPPAKAGGKKKAAKDGSGDSKTNIEDQDQDSSVYIYAILLSGDNVEIKRVVSGGKPMGKCAVNDIKFSPDARFLAAAGSNSKIAIYSLPAISTGNIFEESIWEEWQKALKAPHNVFDKHTSSVIHVDFSLDSKYIQSNDIGNELLFFDLDKMKQEPSASKLADYNNNNIFESETNDDADEQMKLWASQTCVFGWSVQGIWPANSYDSSDINAVDRHSSAKFLATAEDSGEIRILRFPSVTPNSKSIVLKGHSSHVTCVRWLTDFKQKTLVSTGGQDNCIFIWEFKEK